MVRQMRIIGGVVADSAMAVTIALSEPRRVTALVEDVTGSPAGVQVLDYLETGQIIQLASHETLVLNYLNSCVRETIVGGTVTVGIAESEVESGTIQRSEVRCDPRGLGFMNLEFAGRIIRSKFGSAK